MKRISIVHRHRLHPRICGNAAPEICMEEIIAVRTSVLSSAICVVLLPGAVGGRLVLFLVFRG